MAQSAPLIFCSTPADMIHCVWSHGPPSVMSTGGISTVAHPTEEKLLATGQQQELA